MTTFLGSYERPRRQPLGETSRIGRLVRLSEDTLSAVVELGNEQFELPVSPGKYVLGANVAVLESKGKPRRVSGPAGVWPEGLDADADAPDTVTAVEQLGPRELTAAELQAIQDTADGLAEAQADLADAFERIGNLATEVGFAWSGSFEASHPVGSDFRVDWVALGGGEFRFTMVNIPPGANFGWAITLPQGEQVFPTTNPAIVTATEAGSLTVYAWADNENMYVDNQQIEVHPAMLDSTGPLQAAIADASAAAVRASRIAPRSRHEPTIEDGDNRPVGAVWTQVNAEGEELAYWAWDGTEWVPQALSTQVIPYLDAAHITTGVLDTGRVNAIEVWAEIATIGRIITSDLLATGAVTARTLNVVPEEGTGGMELLPPGLRIIPSDAEAGTAVSLRTDEDNWLSFAKNGESTFSVSPEGELVARSVAANDSFAYRGVELADLLERAPQGIVSANRVRLENNFSMDNTERPLFTLDVQGRDPAGGVRAMSIIIQLGTYVLSSSFELSVYSTYDGSTPTLNSARVFQETLNAIAGLTHVDVPIAGRAEHHWRFLVTVRLATSDASARMSVIANSSTVAYVIDHGRAAAWDYQTLTGASATGTAPVAPPATPKTEQTREFPASWVRTFTGSGASYPLASNTKAYTGQYLAQNGVLGSMVGFNRANVAAFTAGAEITNIEVFFKNVHSYSSAGMDAFWGVHGLSTAPSSQNVITGSYSARFNKGQGRWLSVPESHWNAFKSGAATGFTLKPSSTSRSYYGIFNGDQTRLRITVRK